MCHILHYQLKLRYTEAVYVHRYILLYQTLQTLFYGLRAHPNMCGLKLGGWCGVV